LYDLINNADRRSEQMRRAVADWREEIRNLKSWRQEVSEGIDELNDRIDAVKLDIQWKKKERNMKKGRFPY
jgi:archaellum component FlaC